MKEEEMIYKIPELDSLRRIKYHFNKTGGINLDSELNAIETKLKELYFLRNNKFVLFLPRIKGKSLDLVEDYLFLTSCLEIILDNEVSIPALKQTEDVITYNTRLRKEEKHLSEEEYKRLKELLKEYESHRKN